MFAVAVLSFLALAGVDDPVDGDASTIDAADDAADDAAEDEGVVVVDPAGDEVVIVPPPPAVPATAPATARLIYAPGAFADACPDADAIRSLVTHHLGYDPFGEPAQRVLLLALDGTGAQATRARVELLDEKLMPLGSRVVESGAGCAELVATGALQMSIAIDPMAVNVSPPTEPATPTPTPTTTTPEIPDAVDPSGPIAPPAPDGGGGADVTAPTTTSVPAGPLAPQGDSGVSVFVGGGVHIAALLSPEGLMPGLTADVGARWGFASARIEGRFDITDERGTASYPMLLTASPCLHLPVMSIDSDGDGDIEISGCATSTFGIMPAIGVYNGVGVYAGAGMRVGVDWHMPGELTLRTFGQLEAAGLRPQLVTLSGGRYESPGFNVMLGMGFDLPVDSTFF